MTSCAVRALALAGAFVSVLGLVLGCDGKEPRRRGARAAAAAGAADDARDKGSAGDALAIDADDPCGDAGIGARQATARRLTGGEYANVVHDLFGVDARAATGSIPSAAGPGELQALTTDEPIAASHVRKLETVAFDVGEMIAGSEALAPLLAACEARGERCTGRFLDEVAAPLLRRPPTNSERQAYARVLALGRTFREGVALALAALLQSPDFLYRLEGRGVSEDGGVRPLNGYELATRLAFLVWQSTPDDELLQLAADGSLARVEALTAQVRRMLRSDKARRAWREYVTQWLELGSLDGVQKSAAAFPELNAGLIGDMRRETLAFLEDLAFDAKKPLPSMYDARHSFVTPALAALYGLEPPASGDLERRTLPADSGRRGLLFHGSIALLVSQADATSPIKRGLYTNRKVLCRKIPLPPPEALAEAAEDPSTHHQQTPACAGCHRLIDPPGFAFEAVDPLGRMRAAYPDGKPIDTTGTFQAAAGETPFRDAVDLSRLLAADAAAHDCFVENTLVQALGRRPEGEEICRVGAIRRVAAANGFTYAALLEAVVADRAFRYLVSPSK